ncbi:MAG TPA: hypothetical protein VMF51_07830 [Nocardioides sp.]|uniref:hypothetical protein n=1 Tax=Nocardioides sp. TaxID=35761 RepID=UPI002C647163|nr:hypothetical protein [Nocardioides sp.]HTW15023.1 hypothetical protein [Nocardioides sp.]
MPDRPLNLRPSTHPTLVRWLTWVAAIGCVLVLLGAPVWFFMHGDAAGWQEGREVTVSVEPDAWCRTGPPPGSPRTCEASWPGGSGDVSDRYGGPRPETGEQVTARIVGDDLTLTGYSRILLRWALLAPYLTLVGLVLALAAAAALVRLDPRWWGRRTDLI